MLTAQADKESVSVARDAGITEFVAKPFSAKTLSTRIIQIIDNPRVFVESKDFVGPCRRRRGEPPPGVEDRRTSGKPKEAIITPANATLKKQLAVNNASEILNEQVVQTAQQELLKAEDDFIEWAKDDITRLEKAYDHIVAHPGDIEATRQLYEAAYAIKSQAGIFGYPLGAEIATLMIEYLEAHEESLKNTQTIIRKHIDTMSIVFRQKIKESGQGIALDMMFSLKKLIEKLS
jgi:CheY-like chemotaxis protein